LIRTKVHKTEASFTGVIEKLYIKPIAWAMRVWPRQVDRAELQKRRQRLILPQSQCQRSSAPRVSAAFYSFRTSRAIYLRSNDILY